MRHRFRFGRFEFLPAERQLLEEGRPVALGARAFDLLEALIERRDRVVAKAELLDLVWSGLVVEESNLTVQVSTLRKLVGAQAIRTIPGRGYRFTAVIEDPLAEPPPVPGPIDPSEAVRPERVRTNLSVDLLPLYGRDDDLRAICECVDAHRLVTIVGASGVGKTLIAKAAAQGVAKKYVDGAWFVELAPLADGASLATSVAHTLGIALSGPKGPGSDLVAWLEAQSLLLVLDNCEHLVGAVAALSQVLIDRAPGVDLLVTSQVPLGLPIERQFRLGPLAVPDTADCAGAAEYGAVRLFTERVVALDRHFVVGPRNIGTVVDICRHLDGLPLAIELAAPRVPLLGVQGVSERLERRFEVLVSATRCAPPRHQALRSALEWSHDLLADEEKVVFRRLGVFAGSFTAEAAQRVVRDEQLDEWTVLDLLGHLADKSLVAVDGDDRPRLRLLESVRVFADEMLIAAGERTFLKQRHAQYVAAYLENMADALYTGALTEVRFIDARGLEFENMCSAIDSSLRTDGDIEVALRLIVAAAPECSALPLQQQAPAWWRVLTQRLPSPMSAKKAARCRYAWIHWGQVVWWSKVAWPEWPEIAGSPLDALDDPRRHAHALYSRSLKASINGDFSSAYAALDDASALEAPDWPAWLRTRATFARAQFDRHTVGVVASAPALNEALQALECAGEKDGRWAFGIRVHLATDQLFQGRFDESVQRMRLLVEQGRAQRQDSAAMGLLLASFVLALIEVGDLDQASNFAPECAQHVKRSGLWPMVGTTLGLLAVKRGRAELGVRMIGAVDGHWTRRGALPRRWMQHVREMALAHVAATGAGQDIERWLFESQSLDADAFWRLVFASFASSAPGVER